MGSKRRVLAILATVALSLPGRVGHADPPRGPRLGDRLARAAAHEARGQTVLAIAEYRDLAHAYPREPGPYIALVSLYARLGELDEALEVGRVGLSRVPGHVELAGAVADVLVLRGEMREALATVRTACAAHPSDAPCMRLRASVAEGAGATLEALTALRRLLDGAGSDAPMRRDTRERTEVLSLLARGLDPARGRCGDDEPPLARALARCPVSPATEASASRPRSSDPPVDSRARAPACSGTPPPAAR